MTQVTAFAKGLNTKQKLMLLGGALLVAATLLVFVRLTQKPVMKPLMTGLDISDAQNLSQRLTSAKVPNELSTDGSSVSVPVDKLETARLVAASQTLPHTGRLGFEVFDHPNWAATDFNEKVNYQRALEGELERTIQTMDNVAGARVHLALPEDTVFVDREQEAKASVVLRLKTGTLNSSEEMTIARLVAGGVDKLKPENVTVIDGDTNRAFSAGDGTLAGLGGDGLSADDALAQRLVRTLEPVVGAGRIRANVRVEFDQSSSEENSETYDPKSQVALTTTRSEEFNGGGSKMGGIPGTASNVPGSKPAKGSKTQTSASEQSGSTSESATYAINKVVKHSVSPAGQVQRITAALLIDDNVSYSMQGGKRVEQRFKRSPDQLVQITDLAKAAIGMDAARGDVISVQNISFQGEPPVETVPPTTQEKIRQVMRDWSQAIRIGALLLIFALVYLLILRPVKRQVLISLGRGHLLPKKSEAGQALAGSAAREIAQPEPVQIARPPESKMSIIKDELDKLVEKEPQSTARLVESWMQEDQ